MRRAAGRGAAGAAPLPPAQRVAPDPGFPGTGQGPPGSVGERRPAYGAGPYSGRRGSRAGGAHRRGLPAGPAQAPGAVASGPPPYSRSR